MRKVDRLERLGRHAYPRRDNPAPPEADTSTRYIGWCPVCEGRFKVRSSRLVHHGYQRPGIGFIVGDCPGVGYNPYELSTQACEAYEGFLIRRIDETIVQIKEVAGDVPGLKLVFDDYDVVTQRLRRALHSRAPLVVSLTREEADALEAQLPPYHKGRYNWEAKRDQVIRILTRKVEDMRLDLQRIQRLIAEWPGPRPLETVEEEIARQEQTKAEREHARTVARDAKITAEVVKIRNRIDSAVRNRNAAALADIYASSKLESVSGWRLSRDDARRLLERDNIWRAFGLVLSDGSYIEDPRMIEQEMHYGRRVPRPDGGYDYAPMPWPAELGGGFAKSRR